MLSRAGATWLHSWPHLRSRAGLGGPSCRGAQSVSVPDTSPYPIWLAWSHFPSLSHMGGHTYASL